MMRILVTGGAGFIGQHLIPILLNLGHEVTIIDSLASNIHGIDPSLPSFLTNDCRFVVADIRDPKAWPPLLDPTPECVIHLAAETGVGQSMYEIARYTDVNVQGTSVMLDALSEHGGIARLVHASSRAVYGEGSYRCDRCGVVTPPPRARDQLERGDWEPDCPRCSCEIDCIATTEDAARVPTSIYGMTKGSQEDLLTITGRAQEMSTAILRYTNVYGEGQPLTNPYTGVLSAFALRLIRGEYPKVYEDGLPSRDFVHVSDVALTTALAAESESSFVVNVGSGESWTLLDIARELTMKFGMDPSEVQVTGQYRVGDIRAFLADVGRLEVEIPTQRKISFSEGLRRFAAWAQEEASIPTDDVAKRAEAQLRVKGLLGTVDPSRRQ